MNRNKKGNRMKTYSKEELAEVIEKHGKWMKKLGGGERAILEGASLEGANLYGAILEGAILKGAILYGAILERAILYGAKLDKVASDRLSIVPEVGSFVGWKKVRTATGLGTAIVKLLIPEDAPRSNATGRKCRAGWAVVLAGEGVSGYDGETRYAPGMTVKADSFDPDRWKECAPGIHFFITRSEAESHEL